MVTGSTLRRVKIDSLATFVPPRLLTNADLERMVETTDEWILQRTGIRERHVVDAGVATSDLAAEAAREAIAKAGLRADGRITGEVARAALQLLEVDDHGFDEVDRKLLRTIIDKFSGGPVGVNSIAAAINEEKDAIEDIYEPFLIQAGFLDRTPRGRVATARAYEYFGLTAPGRNSNLW